MAEFFSLPDEIATVHQRDIDMVKLNIHLKCSKSTSLNGVPIREVTIHIISNDASNHSCHFYSRANTLNIPLDYNVTVASQSLYVCWSGVGWLPD